MGVYEASNSDLKLSLLVVLHEEYQMVRTVLQGEKNLSFEGMIAWLEACHQEITRNDGKEDEAGSGGRSKVNNLFAKEEQ